MISQENFMVSAIQRALQDELSNQYDKIATEKLQEMQADMISQKNRIIGDILNAVSVQMSDDNFGLGVNLHVTFKNETVLRNGKA